MDLREAVALTAVVVAVVVRVEVEVEKVIAAKALLEVVFLVIALVELRNSIAVQMKNNSNKR